MKRSPSTGIEASVYSGKGVDVKGTIVSFPSSPYMSNLTLVSIHRATTPTTATPSRTFPLVS